MAIKKEVLNGGLVTARHATLLREGEVQQCDDTILRPGDPALYSAPGRTAFGSVRTVTVASCVKNGTIALTAGAGAFGTDITLVAVTSGSNQISKTTALGGLVVGQTVVGTGIPAGAVVTRLISTTTVELSLIATATGTPTITHSDFHPGTFISGTGIDTGTYIASITSGAALTMSAAATDLLTSILTFSEKISGLRAVEFNAGEDALMLARAADKLYTAPMTDIIGATFTERIHGLSQNEAATLETIRASSETPSGKSLQGHIILTGYDPPRVIYLTDNGTGTGAGNQIPASRTLGMKPVKDFISLTIVAGTWSSLSGLGVRWYHFLITEVLNPDSIDEDEGTFTGTPKAIRINDYNTDSVRIQYTTAGSTPVNDGLYGANTATHWRVYMAPGAVDDAEPIPALSAFKAITDVPIADAFTTLSNLNPYQSGYAQTAVNLSGYPSLFPNGNTNALSGVAKQTVVSVTATGGSYELISSGGFTTVTPGMVVTSPTDNIPFGTVVTNFVSSSSIFINKLPTATVTETVYFGNKNSFDNSLAISPGGGSLSNYRAIGFESFGIQLQGAIATATLTGIKVEIRGQYLVDSGTDRGFKVNIFKGGVTGSYGVEKSGLLTANRKRSGPGVLTLGGPSDPWGLSLSMSDIIDGTSGFGVVLYKQFSALPITHYIDGIKVTVYAGSTTITLEGNPFRTVVITDQLGTSTDAGAAGEPPIASTGDIIDGMVILNDVAEENAIVASLPGNMDAFPAGYRLPLESRDNDKVTLIRRYGTGGIIGCQNSMKRLNYFPTEKDADFTRGRCFEDIATDHGAVGPMAATLLDLPGRGSVLAYLSYNGLHWTDAITTSVLNEDLDWGSLIEPTLIQKSVLRVYPKLYLLALYYVPEGGTRLTKVMYFSYHPIHIKPNFKLPAVGPVSCNSGSAASVLLLGIPRLFTGHGTNGIVYLEDSGTTPITGETITPTIRTRSYYLAELGYEGVIERFFLVADASGNAATGGFTGTLYRQNQGEAMTSIDVLTAANTAIGGVIELFPENVGEVFNFTISKSAAQSASLRLHYIGFQSIPLTEDGNG